jgi:hypothetical protein
MKHAELINIQSRFYLDKLGEARHINTGQSVGPAVSVGGHMITRAAIREALGGSRAELGRWAECEFCGDPLSVHERRMGVANHRSCWHKHVLERRAEKEENDYVEEIK